MVKRWNFALIFIEMYSGHSYVTAGFFPSTTERGEEICDRNPKFAAIRSEVTI
jgi:hypothetical protein